MQGLTSCTSLATYDSHHLKRIYVYVHVHVSIYVQIYAFVSIFVSVYICIYIHINTHAQKGYEFSSDVELQQASQYWPPSWHGGGVACEDGRGSGEGLCRAQPSMRRSTS